MISWPIILLGVIGIASLILAGIMALTLHFEDEGTPADHAPGD